MKKQTDHIEIIQKDLQNCIQDFCKAKTVYQEEGEEKTNNKILKKNTKRIKPSANTTNAYVLALLTANTHQVTLSSEKTLESSIGSLFNLILSLAGQILQTRPAGLDEVFGRRCLPESEVSALGGRWGVGAL